MRKRLIKCIQIICEYCKKTECKRCAIRDICDNEICPPYTFDTSAPKEWNINKYSGGKYD